jgi:hypothetical protein
VVQFLERLQADGRSPAGQISNPPGHVKVSPRQGHQASAMEKSSQAFQIAENGDGDWRLEELRVGKVRDLETASARNISRQAELAWELQNIRK